MTRAGLLTILAGIPNDGGSTTVDLPDDLYTITNTRDGFVVESRGHGESDPLTPAQVLDCLIPEDAPTAPQDPDLAAAEAFADRTLEAYRNQDLRFALRDAFLQGWHEANGDRDAHDLVCDRCSDTLRGDSDYRAGKRCPNGCGGTLIDID